MIQVRDDEIYLPDVVTEMMTTINNIYNRIIESGRLSMISVLKSGAGYFLIRTRRMRVLLSKELSMLKNSLWFFDISVYEDIKYNASHSCLTHFCKLDKPDYLLLISFISKKVEQLPPVYDKNIKFVYDLTVDFLLFALSNVSERQISTTIITLPRQVFSAVIAIKGLRHLLCRRLPTGNEPVILKMGLAMSICRTQEEIENEYVFVSVLMIGFDCFTFGFANISKSGHRIVLQSSCFQSEDSSCGGH